MPEHVIWIDSGRMYIQRGGGIRCQPFDNPPTEDQLEQLAEFLDALHSSGDHLLDEIKDLKSQIAELEQEAYPYG